MNRPPDPNPASSALTIAIDRAAALLTTDPKSALRQAESLAASAPRDPRAALVLASARRRTGDPKAALAILSPLAAAFPKAANTQFELGMTLVELGQAGSALAALRRATEINPDHVEAWRAIGDRLFQAGDEAGADQAYARSRLAGVGDAALKPAAEAIFRGDVERAETLLRSHLATRLDDHAATRMLAEVYLKKARYSDAEVLLAHCLTLDPTDDGARFHYADALFRQQKATTALPEIERLTAAEPSNPAYRNLLAAVLGLLGEDERVIDLCAGLVADYPAQPRLWLNYGHALRAVGRSDDAVAAFRRCLALKPGSGEAYWSLANLKVVTFTPEDVAAMEAQLTRVGLAADDALHLHYALGKAKEDARDYDASFAHYALGAALRKAASPYDADANSAQLARVRTVFTPALLARRVGVGCPAPDPIFIVGLPRAGSTLIEQILASHSLVEGTMELPDIGHMAADLGAAYPECLATLDDVALTALGERYIASTRVHRRLGRPRFIDKMPNNFQHIALIRLILPNAKIIDARRNPMASGFSAFKQHFAQGQSFSYDLTDIGRYYRDYAALMDHVAEVAPGAVHRVDYEAMIEDTEREIRRLLDDCSLPFEDSCLRFYETRRAVRTVSSEQVRRPIFREGLDQWRHYEPWLGPLALALWSD